VRHEGDTTIIGVYEERLVVVKQLFLKEEIRLTRRKTEKRTTQSIELREEEVTITRAATGANNLKRDGENAAAGSTPPESP
jgi:stress response protein YsnF